MSLSSGLLDMETSCEENSHPIPATLWTMVASSRTEKEASGPDNCAMANRTVFPKREKLLAVPWQCWQNRFAILDVELYDTQILASQPKAPDADLLATAHHQNTKPTLLTLPFEVRENIFKHLVPEHDIGTRSVNRAQEDFDMEEYHFGPLLRSCSQIHDELAPMVYKYVRIYQGRFRPDVFLDMIGRNVRHIRNVRIDFETRHAYFRGGIAFPLKPWVSIRDRFPFIDALKMLQTKGKSLRVIYVDMSDFSRTARRGGRAWEKHYKTVRSFFPEIMYTLRELAHFKRVEKIVFSDDVGAMKSWDPLVLYYLRGQLGFELQKAEGVDTRLKLESDRLDLCKPILKKINIKTSADILVNPHWGEEKGGD